jgi:predicted alpha/beta hydrolase family esterase
MNRVFIIHGWSGYPDEGWLPWLKKELISRVFEATTPAMPDPDYPKIGAWTHKLAEIVGDIDQEIYLVGHSIGCQTILRYLESVREGKKAAGVVLVAPWVTLTDAAHETEEDWEIARPWIETPIDWEKVKNRANKFTAIFSTNDDVINSNKNVPTFRDKLGAEIIIERDKGHFSGSDGVTELPSALTAIVGK